MNGRVTEKTAEVKEIWSEEVSRGLIGFGPIKSETPVRLPI